MLRALLSSACLFLAAGSSAAGWPDLSRTPKAPALHDKDAAIVVGIEHYAFVPEVPGAAKNAEDWQAYLTGTRGIPASQVKLLRDSEATLDDLRREAAWAAGAVKPGGTLWFIFIGHGAPSPDGKDGVLVGADAQQRAESLFARSMRRGELLETLGKSAASRRVVLLDACFSGRTPSGAPLAPGLQPLIVAGAAGALPPDTTLMTAGRSDEFAGPLPGLRRPAFSYLVLGALRGWAADKDGAVTARAAVSYARGALQALLRDRRQTPEVSGNAVARLATAAREVGPDIAALARAPLASATDGPSELAFGAGHPPQDAPSTAKGIEGGFKGVDAAIEALFEDAVFTERDAKTTGEEKMAAWCQLGELTENNPYSVQAKTACIQWQRYEEARIQRESTLGEDFKALTAYLRLRLKTAAQKRAALDAFLRAYRDLGALPQLVWARAAQESVAAGKPLPALERKPELPDLAPLTPPNSIRDVAVPDGFSFEGDKADQCRSGNGFSCGYIASTFSEGLIPSDPKQRDALVLLACYLGDESSCEGSFLTDKSALTLRVLALGCGRRGIAHACERAADLAKASDDSYARSRFLLIAERGCLLGQPSGCSGVGDVLSGGPEAGRDLPRARSFYALACGAGDERACAVASSLAEHRQ